MERISVKLLVVGDEGSGKRQFQKQFLEYYEGTADVHRKTDDLYVIKIFKKKNISIWFYVVKSIATVTEQDFEMHGIFFCYSLNHLNSLINLEKNWIEPLASKADRCFLVPKEIGLYAEEDGVHQQHQRHVLDKAKKLAENYQLKNCTKYDNIKSFLDDIMNNTFLDKSFLQILSDRRWSTEDSFHEKDPIENKHSPKSSPNFFAQRRPRKPYVKQGKSRPIF